MPLKAVGEKLFEVCGKVQRIGDAERVFISVLLEKRLDFKAGEHTV